MTNAELIQALKAIGYPVAYSHFVSTPENPAPPPPFITVQFAFSGDVMADNLNYVEVSNYQVELYTTKKDVATEKLVQDKLKELRMPYSKTATWLDEEKLFQTIYEIQLIGE
ncbi:hypothetical protein EXW96_26460 [Paenibacillus sp. JMULE4]|uniref:hypothetical protein n=1 Tax=Paenibacillus sp. JMULE4 TaxID=2518342 RepID=UPI0015771ADB|nr:hypothetical protein [Paenibacillus sp. JMULE4]NTZ20933.1 hypothetical protein [Paenibacillus sp. JMULE4]